MNNPIRFSLVVMISAAALSVVASAPRIFAETIVSNRTRRGGAQTSRKGSTLMPAPPTETTSLGAAATAPGFRKIEDGQTPAPSFSSVRTSVIIPALNEADNLPLVLARIPHWVDEVILVDGNSTDNTVQVARQWWPSVRIVPQRGPGKGNALRTGLESASGDILVMIDADGSMDPGEISSFVGALLAGADMAKGSRFLQGGGTSDMPLYRQLGNFGFVLLVRLLFGGNYSDLCYGYNAIWRRDLARLGLDCDGFEIETVLNIRALRQGLRVAEVPSYESARVYGTGRLRTIPDGWRVLKALLGEALNHHTGRAIQSSLAVAPEVAVQVD